MEVTEKLGSETFLYLDVAGLKLTARVDRRSTAGYGDKVDIALDANRIHIFDIDTEETIIN